MNTIQSKRAEKNAKKEKKYMLSWADLTWLNFFIALTNHSDSCYVTDSMFLLLLVDFKLLKAKTETSFNVW